MLSMDLNLHGDGAWPDLTDIRNSNRLIHLNDGQTLRIAGLNAGTVSGRPSVAIRIDLPDGRVVVAETTLALFTTAAQALQNRFGAPQGPSDPHQTN